ncbi:MAG: hypothetical protein J0H08_18405, partial [Rhizobiales bacterium]|nr:hypothetical protein [Hyphomicrobiales bacterium]
HLIASIPHDEVGIAEKRSSALGGNPADGVSRILRTEDGRPDRIVVGRTPLFDDTLLALAIDLQDALRGWDINRDCIIGAAVASVVIVVAFALVLLLALRQRERAEAARNRAASVLVNAIDAMSDGFAMWDEEDRLVTCNERYVEMSPVSAA